jgi:hypothetical protein
MECNLSYVPVRKLGGSRLLGSGIVGLPADPWNREGKPTSDDRFP